MPRLFTNARTRRPPAKFPAFSPAALSSADLAPQLVPGPYGDYVLSVGRIESVKRVDLIIKAMASVDAPTRLVIAGDGTQRQNAERAAAVAGVADRITFLGNVGDDDLIGLYAGALAVVYPPFDEDFGYVTLEAFLARGLSSRASIRSGRRVVVTVNDSWRPYPDPGRSSRSRRRGRARHGTPGMRGGTVTGLRTKATSERVRSLFANPFEPHDHFCKTSASRFARWETRDLTP